MQHTVLASPPPTLPQLRMHPGTHFYYPPSLPSSTQELKSSHGDAGGSPSLSATREAPLSMISEQPPRKRQRTSSGSHSPHRSASRDLHVSTKHDSSLSPHTSSRSDSAE